MLNREIYVKDPSKNKILNDGVASVTDEATPQNLATLRFELETFVCDGQYERGLKHILQTFLDNITRSEQPGVWVSGFFGSGKSHLVKMLRALWMDVTFPEDQATARGLVRLPQEINELLLELDNAQRRNGGIHAASGTLGAGVGDVRLALLGIVFKSAGLAESYPLARFEMWLKSLGYYDAVRADVEATGKEWRRELLSLYLSPAILGAIRRQYPALGETESQIGEALRAQFPIVTSVSNDDMVDAIRDALTRDGKFPLTLLALDEVQQFIGDDQSRTYVIQEVVETCSKRFGGKLMFVGTGQTALSGTPNLQKLMGRFTVNIELSDNDVDAVVRQVILAKKPDALSAVERLVNENLGEISRHLAGTKIEHQAADLPLLAADYPILPVRRRFWERTLRAVDQSGTTGQLRNQLKLVHEAAQATADRPLGHVVGGDFVFNEVAPNLLQAQTLGRELYEYIRSLSSGSESDILKARLLSLIYLIGKLPREAGADVGVRAKTEVLADLLVEDLKKGSAPLRQAIPPLLEALEADGKIMRVDDEYRLQTVENSAWTDEFNANYSRIMSNPARIGQERLDLFRKEYNERVKGVRLLQGESKESRSIHVHIGAVEPTEQIQGVRVWFRDGWEEEQKNVHADILAAGNDSPVVYVYVPRRSADELHKTLATLRAATATLEQRGRPTTIAGEEARAAMQTTAETHAQRLTRLLDEVFGSALVYQGGGQEVDGPSLADAVKLAAERALKRLYPKFSDADHKNWSKVIERARQGSGDTLEDVGYQGEVIKHPVVAALLPIVGQASRGADVRKHFEDPPYGWPKDAIDGAIYTLVASGHLRATDATGKALGAKTLERAKIAQTSFRKESTTITALERIHIRQMLKDIDLNVENEKELEAMPKLFRALDDLAQAAGGEAPSPVSPSTQHLDELRALAGNEQLAAVLQHKDILIQNARDWKATGQRIQERWAPWQMLEGLLQQAAHLSATQPIREQAKVIREERRLLHDPDLVPPLVDQLTQLLRNALIEAQSEFKETFERGVATMLNDDNWSKLAEDQKHSLRVKQQVTIVPEIATGTTKEVLSSLRALPLASWADRTAALPTRFEAVQREAAELVLPSPKFVRISRATVASHEELAVWLERVRQEVQQELDSASGAPVVIQ